jgi:hypothetical protein
MMVCEYRKQVSRFGSDSASFKLNFSVDLSQNFNWNTKQVLIERGLHFSFALFSFSMVYDFESALIDLFSVHSLTIV